MNWSDPSCACCAHVSLHGKVFWFMRESGAGIGRQRATQLLAAAGFDREVIERELLENPAIVQLTYVTLRGAPTATGKTFVWSVESRFNNGLVGRIKWFGKWRKYAFYPEAGCVFEEVCLREIADFIEARTKEWHAERTNE